MRRLRRGRRSVSRRGTHRTYTRYVGCDRYVGYDGYIMSRMRQMRWAFVALVCSGAVLLAQGRGGRGGGAADQTPLQLPADTPRIADLKKESIAEVRSAEHTSELQSLRHLVCRLL